MRFACALLLLAPSLRAGVSFDIGFGAKPPEAHDGRVVVYLVGPNRNIRPGQDPASWDYCLDPMPVIARDAKHFGGDSRVTLDAAADAYRIDLGNPPPGTYIAQAVFDWQHEASGWDMEPGNRFSKSVAFDVKAGSDAVVKLDLDQVVEDEPVAGPNVELVEVRSKLLSDFTGRDVKLRAGVVMPIDYKPDGRYGVIYEVPGFGGRHTEANHGGRQRERLARAAASDAKTLATRTFHVFLDPESPNGHTLFTDSDVNGPWGRALVEELIPAIEQKFPSIIAEPRARLLRGHSSGGYSVCSLQVHFPDFFGGAWPSSPDPVDFRKFELIDLYAADNLYVASGQELPSARDGRGNVTLHVREENAWEQTVCPDNRGGLQWQSWQAVFGVPRGDGTPNPLYDIRTGVIDRSQIDHYRRHDLAAMLAADPAKYAPVWREKIHLLVGGGDDFYLDEAVKLVGETLAKLPPTGTAETNRGYVKIVPGKTHGSIYQTPEMAAFWREMLDTLGRAP
jgi:hypothetical protein